MLLEDCGWIGAFREKKSAYEDLKKKNQLKKTKNPGINVC